MKKLATAILSALFIMAPAIFAAAENTPVPQVSITTTLQTTPQAAVTPSRSGNGTEKVNIIELDNSNSKSDNAEAVSTPGPEATPPVTTPSETAQATSMPAETSEATPVQNNAAVESDNGAGIVLLAGTKEQMIKNDYLLIERSGFISDDFTQDGFVYTLDGRTTLQQGMFCYVKMAAGKNVKPGMEFLAYSDDRAISDPGSGEDLGRLINVDGVGTVIENSTGDIWKAKIDKNYNILYDNSKIKLRDEFREYFDRVASTVKMRTGQVEGRIILRQNGYANGLKIKDIVYVNRGFRDGLRPGDKLSVIRVVPDNDIGTGGDYNQIGTALVLNVMDKTSTAVITGDTDVIQVGDTVKILKK